MDNKETEAKLKRIERYRHLETLPQFFFMQDIIMIGGFYKWFKGKVFKEIDFVLNPEDEERKDGVVVSYEVMVYDNAEWEEDKIIDHRVIETEHIQAV